MLVKDLQSLIKTKNIPNVLVLFGEEVAVRDLYLNKVLDVLTGNASILRCNSVSDSVGIVGSRGLENRSRAVLVRNDNEFIKQETAWQKVFKLFEETGNYLILCYTNIDKRGKFYKKHSDAIIQFEKLDSSVILKHLKELDIPQNKLKKFVEMCDYNYSIVLNEMDKIKTYAKAQNISNERSLDVLMENKLIHTIVGDITFKFTDAIFTRNKKLVLYYLDQIKEINESPILTMSVLYTGFKNVLLVQGLGKDTTDMANRTGLSYFQCKLAKEKCGYYSIYELVNILKTIQEYEKGVKIGMYSMDNVIDSLLVHTM